MDRQTDTNLLSAEPEDTTVCDKTVHTVHTDDTPWTTLHGYCTSVQKVACIGENGGVTAQIQNKVKHDSVTATGKIVGMKKILKGKRRCKNGSTQDGLVQLKIMAYLKHTQPGLEPKKDYMTRDELLGVKSNTLLDRKRKLSGGIELENYKTQEGDGKSETLSKLYKRKKCSDALQK
jgi:hypothetical protein